MRKRIFELQPFGWMALFLFLICCGQKTPDAIFNRGLKALDEGDVIGASLYFDEFVKKFPAEERLLRAYELLANCHYQLKDFASARAVFEEVRQKFPDANTVVSCDFQIGRTYLEEGNLIKAASHFTEIAGATTNPKILAGAYSWLAQVYARQTLSASAVAEFEKIYRIGDQQIKDPTEKLDLQLVALAGEARVYLASREFEDARQTYRRTLELVKNATGIIGVEGERQNAVVNWAHTWGWAGDYVSSATVYDQLQTNPYIMSSLKPQLIVWKIQSLLRLLTQDNKVLTPEEIALVVHEYERLVKDFPNTDQGIDARVEIAALVKDSTPSVAERYLSEAVEKYEKYIAEPPNPDRPRYAMFKIADAYIKMGKYPEAKQMIQKMQQAYSNVPETMQQAIGMLNFIRRIETQKAQEKEGKNATPAPTPPAAKS